MKKFIVAILAVFYLGVSSGATLHFHHCMGQLVEWGLASKKQAMCSKCGMKTENTKNCCKDEQKQLKIDSCQKVSENTFQLKAFSIELGTTTYNSSSDLYVTSLTEAYPISNAPPKTQNTPAFIRNCNFRI